MLSGRLPVNKHWWLMFYLHFLIFIFLIFQVLVSLLTSKNGWHISSGAHSTI